MTRDYWLENQQDGTRAYNEQTKAMWQKDAAASAAILAQGKKVAEELNTLMVSLTGNHEPTSPPQTQSRPARPAATTKPWWRSDAVVALGVLGLVAVARLAVKAVTPPTPDDKK